MVVKITVSGYPFFSAKVFVPVGDQFLNLLHHYLEELWHFEIWMYYYYYYCFECTSIKTRQHINHTYINPHIHTNISKWLSMILSYTWFFCYLQIHIHTHTHIYCQCPLVYKIYRHYMIKCRRYRKYESKTIFRCNHWFKILKWQRRQSYW